MKTPKEKLKNLKSVNAHYDGAKYDWSPKFQILAVTAGLRTHDAPECDFMKDETTIDYPIMTD
jgi:hypothetical protein